MDERDEIFEIPFTDNYVALRSGEILRPISDGYVSVPRRKIGKYWYCHVKHNAKYRSVRVNRILCMAFHGAPPSPRHVARHLNDNKDDNSYQNLAWGTVRDNSMDAIKNGVASMAIIGKGEDHPHCRLTEVDVIDIRSAIAFGATGADLADAFGVSRATISMIRNRKIWGHI